MSLSSAANSTARKTLRRAQRALRCSPFYMKLLADMRSQSVSLQSITDDRGTDNLYTRRPLSELAAESALLWLMAVGVLRREVDGQGLTDSFRLTPLGRDLLDQWHCQGCPDRRGHFIDNLLNASQRWLRLPNWLQ